MSFNSCSFFTLFNTKPHVGRFGLVQLTHLGTVKQPSFLLHAYDPLSTLSSSPIPLLIELLKKLFHELVPFLCPSFTRLILFFSASLKSKIETKFQSCRELFSSKSHLGFHQLLQLEEFLMEVVNSGLLLFLHVLLFG